MFSLLHPKKKEKEVLTSALFFSSCLCLELAISISWYVYSRWKTHIMELFNEVFITFKHKCSSLCWRLMTHNVSFAKLTVQGKDEITVSLILVAFKNTSLLFRANLPGQYFIEEGIYSVFSQSFPIYLAFQLFVSCEIFRPTRLFGLPIFTE